MFSILAYGQAVAALNSLVQLPALADPAFVPQNSNFIFYEPYRIIGLYGHGVSLTALQLFDTTWNSLNVPQIYPVDLSLNIPANPNVLDYRQYPLDIPMNEQIQVQASNNLAMGTESEALLMWITPPSDPRTIPPPPPPYGNMGRIRALFTTTIALTANAWSPDAAVTVPNLIKGGTYCVVGCQLVAARGVAVRINFPRAPLYQGRKLFPGDLCTAAYGNVPSKLGPQAWGPWGYFDTTEYFQMAVLANTTVASATYTGYLDLIYMGQNLIGQGGMSPM